VSKRGSKGKAVWSNEDLAAYVRRRPQHAPQALCEPSASPHGSASGALADVLGEGGKGRLVGQPRARQGEGAKKPSGVNMGEVIRSVRQAIIHLRVARAPDGRTTELVLWFDGARLMTQNQLISKLQKDMRMFLAYKKAWQLKMREALVVLRAEGGQPCQFTDPVLIEVLRQANRRVDRDGVEPLFKILIDQLHHRPAGSTQPTVIPDDNPDVVVAIVPHQRSTKLDARGRPGVGLRLVAQPGWRPPPPPDPWAEWLGQAEPGA